MRAHLQTVNSSSSAPNFALHKRARKSTPTLAQLLDAMNAAVAEVGEWCSVEDRMRDKFNEARGPAPKVLGGMTPDQKIVFGDGRPDIILPAREWFFHSRDEIEQSKPKYLADATSDAERSEIEVRFAGYLAEFDRQEKAYKRAEPKALREARRKLDAAHRAWNEAEFAITGYEPTSLAEVVTLLEFAGRTGEKVFFTPDEDGLKDILRNAAAAIRTAI